MAALDWPPLEQRQLKVAHDNIDIAQWRWRIWISTVQGSLVFWLCLWKILFIRTTCIVSSVHRAGPVWEMWIILEWSACSSLIGQSQNMQVASSPILLQLLSVGFTCYIAFKNPKYVITKQMCDFAARALLSCGRIWHLHFFSSETDMVPPLAPAGAARGRRGRRSSRAAPGILQGRHSDNILVPLCFVQMRTFWIFVTILGEHSCGMSYLSQCHYLGPKLFAATSWGQVDRRLVDHAVLDGVDADLEWG